MASPHSELPSSLRSLGRSLRMGYRAEPLLLVVAFATTILAAAPDALFAVGLALLAAAVLAGDPTGILVAAGLLGALATGSWVLGVVGDRINLKLTDRAAVQIESHVVRLQSSVATIEHHERPEYADRLSLLRNHAPALSELYQMLFVTLGAILRLGITLALLMSVRPILGLLGLVAIPAVLVANRRAGIEKAAEEAGAQHERRARSMFLLGTTPAPGKELRVAGVQQRVRQEMRDSWRHRLVPLARARWASAAWQSAAYALFGCTFVAAAVYVAGAAGTTAGEVMLVLAAGSRLSHYLGETVHETHLFRSIWLDGARRLAWLEDFAKVDAVEADLPVPDRIRHGIRLDNVCFRYPGTDRDVLTGVTLDLTPGSVVAIVGENGAGKSSLVKLLCKLYRPTSGTITVDGADLVRIPATGWRSRLSGAFQDFCTFEFPVHQSVGLGDLDNIEDRSAVAAAVSRADADDLVAKLGHGLDTQLGAAWPGGVDLSHGQWQKLALARTFMRTEPLLLLLDEPTAALDAETEHALFESHTAAVRASAAARSGRITVLVSHRFSTVRMADVIVVLDDSRIVETGSHDELMAHDGQYASLYKIQAASYR